MELRDLRKVVESDSETKKLKVDDIDLNVVYQYIIERDNLANVNYRPVLKLEPYIHIVYIATPKKEEELAKEKLIKYSGVVDSDVFIQDARLDSFSIYDEKREKALSYAKNFIDNYPDIEKGMYLHGPYGAGKSYLLSAIAKELMLKKIPVSFVFVPDLVRGIKADMGKGNLEVTVNKLKSVAVLMLDDLGGEYSSPWFRDEILLPLIQYRLSAKLPIFISSNLSYDELLKTMSANERSDNMTKNTRILNRIVDLTKSFILIERYTKD